MTKDIEFIYINEYAWNVCERPSPASSYVPKWFRDFPPYDSSNNIKIDNRRTNTTAKKCVPMLDGILSGYIIPLWSDILISREQFDGNESLNLSWRVSEDVFELHGDNSKNIPPPAGYQNIVFKFRSMLTIKTPPGYSIMINQPHGHNDLPFYAVPAVIDSDGSNHELNFPVWIREGFSGIVEKGTPIVQITPFKRDSWKSNFSYMTDKEYQYYFDKEFVSTIKNRYLKRVWSKKDYK